MTTQDKIEQQIISALEEENYGREVREFHWCTPANGGCSWWAELVTVQGISLKRLSAISHVTLNHIDIEKHREFDDGEGEPGREYTCCIHGKVRSVDAMQFVKRTNKNQAVAL
ncbi:MAG: hypothetical protein ACF8OB_12915 [Phycisphaeraceae bacterium JB051]